MKAQTVLTAIDGALDLLEGLGPLLQEMVKTGEISIEEQAARDDRIASLRPGGTAFAGPEWKIEPS